MNALYMSADSVTIQLLAIDQEEDGQHTKYADIAQARGHYLEWANPDETNHLPGDDVTDTTVNVKSFTELIEHALTLGINNRLRT